MCVLRQIRSWDATKTLDHIFKESDDGKSPRSFISCVSEVGVHVLGKYHLLR